MGALLEEGSLAERVWTKAVSLVEEANAALLEPPTNESVVWPLGGVVAYLSGIYLLHLWMRSKPTGCFDKALRWPLVIHNYILCFFSLALVIGLTYRVIDNYRTCGGLFAVYCGCTASGYDNTQNRNLMYWAYLFYLSKYYELLDTVFLVLRKRPLNFLHVYHHAIVMPMCWFALNQGTALPRFQLHFQ